MNKELIFEVIKNNRGIYSATCLNERLKDTGGASLGELHDNITAVVKAHFAGGPIPPPGSIHLMMFAE